MPSAAVLRIPLAPMVLTAVIDDVTYDGASRVTRMHALDLKGTSGPTVRFVPLRYLEYEASRSVPNVVVDGSPNESTRLTLTHWPGHRAPDGFADDLSAQMAFRYL